MPKFFRPSRDTLWVRLACLVDPPFSPGVPWGLAPSRWELLEKLGYVEAVTQPNGKIKAVGTPKGHAYLEGIRTRHAERGTT